jgi:2,6-dihydroxypseudooxynicotine hydrolase
MTDSRTIDTATFVEDAWELFSWRILSNYVSPWELSQIKAEIQVWDQWCGVWSSWARLHVERADEAAAAGHRQTAAAAYVTAGLFYHWASFLFTHDSGQFRAALEAAEESFAKAAPLVGHPMEIIHLPFEDTKLRGYLRLPHPTPDPSPLMVLIPGADSTKEELYDLGDHILRRGIAVYCFDGPGHGLVSFDLKLRREYEGPLRTIVDHLTARPDIDGSRVALGGISYGGMSAIRGAVFDDRVKAVVSVSSWYSAAGRFRHQRELSRIALLQYLGPDPAAVQDTMTLEGVAERLSVPLLQVYGGLDAASPLAQAQQVADAVKGPNVLKVFEDGVHVCNNVWYKARPFIADWLSDTL